MILCSSGVFGIAVLVSVRPRCVPSPPQATKQKLMNSNKGTSVFIHRCLGCLFYSFSYIITFVAQPVDCFYRNRPYGLSIFFIRKTSFGLQPRTDFIFPDYPILCVDNPLTNLVGLLMEPFSKYATTLFG